MRVFLKGNIKIDDKFYKKGYEVDIPDRIAEKMIANGTAEEPKKIVVNVKSEKENKKAKEDK